MPIRVADIRANLNENIRHAAKVIGKSKDRRKVFEAIYRGKKPTKTVQEIANATGLKRMRVLQEGKVLVANQIVEQTKKDGDTAYSKEEIYTLHKKRVLSIIDNPSKAAKYPTKQSPTIGSNSIVYKFTVKGKSPIAEYLTVDDIDSFKQVRSITSVDKSLKLNKLEERKIKLAFQEIIGESFGFDDWGGEKNDLFTTKLEYKSKRLRAAFAFKGKGTQGVLTPKKMGKNGDQIPRLGGSPAEMFIVVYHSKIDESIIEQLKGAALVSAMSGKKIYYCTVDGDDLNRLHQAYETAFK